MSHLSEWWPIALIMFIMLCAVGSSIYMSLDEYNMWVTRGKSKYYLYQENKRTGDRRAYPVGGYAVRYFIYYGMNREWVNKKTDVLDVNEMN